VRRVRKSEGLEEGSVTCLKRGERKALGLSCYPSVLSGHNEDAKEGDRNERCHLESGR
jgi:hypothetical protein